MTTTGRNMLRVTAAPLTVLTVLFCIPGHSAVGSAYPVGTANGGGTILFSRQNHWYTIAPNGTHLHMLLSTTAGCPDFGCASFSPDGSRIMVAAQTADKKRITVAIVNTNGSGYHLLPLPDRTLNIEPGAWLPLGNHVAVHGWDNSNKKRDGIYELNASDGAGFRRLTMSPDGRAESPLAFSPDGSRLLFYHEHPVPGSWSPDGKRVTFTAFSLPMSGASAVFVANANGSQRRRITLWGIWSTSAHWSPNGNWIVFDKMAAGSGVHNLYLVHPNGTGLKAITSTSLGGVCCAVWSPTGNKLLTNGEYAHLLTMNRNGSGIVKLGPGSVKDQVAEYAWGR